METEQAYFRSVRSILMEAFDGDHYDDRGAVWIAHHITDTVRDLMRLDAVLELVRGNATDDVRYPMRFDAVLELVQGNAEVAGLIMDCEREMIQCDYIEGVRYANSLQHIFQLIQGGPLRNDVRVVIAGFERTVELSRNLYLRGRLFPTLQMNRPRLELNREQWAIVLSKMDAHRWNALVQRHGIDVISTFANRSSRELFASMIDSLVTAMLLHAHEYAIQIWAADALHRLRESGGLFERGQIANQFVRAPQGNRRGIHALFQALENFPTDEEVVRITFSYLMFLDVNVHGELENYTNAHGNWREIFGNTDPKHRPFGTFLGSRIGDF